MAMRQSAVACSATVKPPNQLANRIWALDQLVRLLTDWIDRNCNTNIDTDLVRVPNRTNLNSVRFLASLAVDLVTFPSKYSKTMRAPTKPHRAIETMNL